MWDTSSKTKKKNATASQRGDCNPEGSQRGGVPLPFHAVWTSLPGKESKLKGHAFEEEVVQLLRAMGHRNVVPNYRLKDSNGNLSEIDVVTGWVFKTYVECKKYDSKSVPLEDVAKFKEVLRMNGISSRRGLFVTNSKYSPRATEVGIRTIDGMQLDALRSRWAFPAATKLIAISGI